MITWKENGVNIDFEIFGKKEYTAIGFSTDKEMGRDSVLGCLKTSDPTPRVRAFYSDSKSQPKTLDSYNGITSEKNEVDGAAKRCRFSRRKEKDGSEVFALSSGNSYFLLVASGSVESSTIEYHGTDRKSTTVKVDFTKFQNVGGSNAAPGLVKAHAILMSLAWGIFIPVGIYLAAYYKDFLLNKQFKGVAIWFIVSKKTRSINENILNATFL